LAYDVTSFSTRAKGIEEAEWGCDRDGDKVPQSNLGRCLSERTGLPACATYPGSITDKPHLPRMPICPHDGPEWGAGHIVARGRARSCFPHRRSRSAANIQRMAKEGRDFIIGAGKRHKATRAALEQARDGIVIGSIRDRISQDLYAVSAKGARSTFNHAPCAHIMILSWPSARKMT
jgi:hypothetical protein